MSTRLLFTIIYLPLIIVLGELLHRKGRIIVQHAFGGGGGLDEAVMMLLRLGWYVTSLGLLLWNVGCPDSDNESVHYDVWTLVSFRLGAVLFVLGILHIANLFAVSLFHRKNRV